MSKKTTSEAEPTSNCRQVSTQAELDEALAASACVHVQGGAEASVLEWQAANTPVPEIAGEW